MTLKHFVVGCIMLISGFIYLANSAARKSDLARWDTSPCGTKTFSRGYVLGDFYSPGRGEGLSDYKDDGVRVWRIKSIYFKKFDTHTKMTQTPEVEWEIAMERTSQACQAWIEKTGINLTK